MKIVTTVQEMKNLRKGINGSVGFVPTMGYLHEGHLSLVRQARRENDITVTSIYVNPTQFGPHEDYQVYPRDPDRDSELLKREGNDILFMPSDKEMYPEGYCSWVEVKGLTERLEGACRPGHFKGVTTIVTKLFNIVSPHKAYFGQKDAQQAIVIKKMVRDLNMNLEIVVMPTIREADGLAMSSRNVYLNPEERIQATILFRALNLAKKLRERGEKDATIVKNDMIELIKTQPLAEIDYVSIADPENLEELKEIRGPALCSLAVKIGKTRLIDNLII